MSVDFSSRWSSWRCWAAWVPCSAVVGALVLVPIAETTRAVWRPAACRGHLIVYGALLWS